MLTPDQRQALDDQGYLVLPDALDPGQVARLRVAFDGAPATSGTQHVEITPETPHHADWAALSTHPALRDGTAHLLGDAPWNSEAHGRNPLPGYGQQGLHADWGPRARATDVYVVTTLWMLDDFTADNGATRVVPGSHRQVQPISKALAQPQSRHPHEVIVTGRAGSVLLFNGHLWHSGRQNTSKSSRRTVQLVARRRAWNGEP